MDKEAGAERPLSVAAIIVLALVFLLYVFVRMFVPLELVEIRQELGFSLAQAGLLASVFTFGLTIMAIPAGIVAARFGTRVCLVIGALIFSACSAWTGLGGAFATMAAARIGGGIGEGLFNISLLSYLGRLTERHRAAAAGLPASFFGIGIFLAPLVASPLLVWTGNWRIPLIILAVLGIIGAITAWYLLGGSAMQAPVEKRVPITAASFRKLFIPGVIALCCAVAVNGVAVYSFVSLYNSFLRTVIHLSIAGASVVISSFGVGQIFGGMPMGHVADLIGRRRFLATCALVLAVSGAAIFYLPSSVLVLSAVCFVFGLFTNAYYVDCIALVQDHVDHDEIPLATGVLTTVYYLTAAFSGYVLVKVTNVAGWSMAGVLTYGIPYAIAFILVISFVRGRGKVSSSDR